MYNLLVYVGLPGVPEFGTGTSDLILAVPIEVPTGKVLPVG